METFKLYYSYKSAKQYIQIMSLEDIIRIYHSMIRINSENEARELWNLLNQNINYRIFDSFSHLNETVIQCIKEYKKRPKQKVSSLLGKRKR